MKKIKLSDKDAKMLFLFLTIVVIVGTYFLVYSKNMKRASEISKENQTLQETLNALEIMEGEEVQKRQQIEDLTAQTQEILSKFAGGMTTQQIISVLNEMENYVDMTIPEETFILNDVFYTQSGEQTDAAAAGEMTEEQIEAAGVNTASNIVAYKSSVSISFSTTYKNLKKAVDFINSYKDRMVIDKIALSYDSSNGNLSGTMDINFYSVTGTDKEYKDPDIDGINIGVKNIFGSLLGDTDN